MSSAGHASYVLSEIGPSASGDSGEEQQGDPETWLVETPSLTSSTPSSESVATPHSAIRHLNIAL